VTKKDIGGENQRPAKRIFDINIDTLMEGTSNVSVGKLNKVRRRNAAPGFVARRVTASLNLEVSSRTKNVIGEKSRRNNKRTGSRKTGGRDMGEAGGDEEGDGGWLRTGGGEWRRKNLGDKGGRCKETAAG